MPITIYCGEGKARDFSDHSYDNIWNFTITSEPTANPSRNLISSMYLDKT